MKKLIFAFVLSLTLFLFNMNNVKALELIDTQITPWNFYISSSDNQQVIYSPDSVTYGSIAYWRAYYNGQVPNLNKISVLYNLPTGYDYISFNVLSRLNSDFVLKGCQKYSNTTLVDNDSNISLFGSSINSTYICPISSNGGLTYFDFLFPTASSLGGYFYISKNVYFYKESVKSVVEQQIIQNHNDSIDVQNKIDDTNNKIQETNDFIKDSNITDSHDIQGSFDEITGMLNFNEDFLLELITIPYNLLNTLVNTSEEECRSINLGSLFGTNIVLPCINWGDLVGEYIYTIIDIIVSGCISLAFLNKLKMIFNKIMTLSSDVAESCDIEIMK